MEKEIICFIFGESLQLVLLKNWSISSVLSNLCKFFFIVFPYYLFDVCSDIFYFIPDIGHLCLLFLCQSWQKFVNFIDLFEEPGFVSLIFSIVFPVFIFIDFCSHAHCFLSSACFGFICSSFSTLLWWDLRLLIQDFSPFLMYAFGATNVPLSPTFNSIHNFAILNFNFHSV